MIHYPPPIPAEMMASHRPHHHPLKQVQEYHGDHHLVGGSLNVQVKFELVSGCAETGGGSLCYRGLGFIRFWSGLMGPRNLRFEMRQKRGVKPANP